MTDFLEIPDFLRGSRPGSKPRKSKKDARMTSRTFRIPTTFWVDYFERRDGEAPGIRRIMAQSARYALVELDAVALEDLRDDAAFYADPDGPDAPGLHHLKKSAAAVVRALAAQAK